MEAIAATAATKRHAAARALPWIHLAVRSTKPARACEVTGETGVLLASGCSGGCAYWADSGCADGCAYWVNWTGG